MATMTWSLGLIKLNKSNYTDKVRPAKAKPCHTCTKIHITNTISLRVRWDLRSCQRDDKHKVRGLGHTDRAGVSEQPSHGGKCCVRANIEGAGVIGNTQPVTVNG